jgi:hypothetical protein
LKKGVLQLSPVQEIERPVCIVCGSMQAETCPACKNARFFSQCWTSPFGEKRCTCGFRHPGYKKG